MNEYWQGLIAVATAVVGVAVLAVLVSRNSNTAGVLSSLSGGLAQDIAAAEAPVSGGGFGTNLLGANALSGGGGYNFIQ